MLEVLTDFASELREDGLSVSPQEVIDAAAALVAVGLFDEETVRFALQATLSKTSSDAAAFLLCFETFFARIKKLRPAVDLLGEAPARSEASSSPEDSFDAAFKEALSATLSDGSEEALRHIAHRGVAAYAGIEPDRPVGLSYYLYRTLRAMGLDDVLSQLLEQTIPGGGEPAAAPAPGRLGRRLRQERLSAAARRVSELVSAELRRLLVAERGANAVRQSLRRAALEDVDFMHMGLEELSQLRRALRPLAQVLRARLARRRRHLRKGPLDVRATMRRSLSSGGVPLEPRFRPPRPHRPQIAILADVSGSVASFARFTLQLVYCLDSQFSSVRSFVFVDGVDEVSGIFRRSRSLSEAIRRIDAEADVTAGDGHSDYGRVFESFARRFAPTLSPRTDLLVLGDARNNYHGVQEEAFGAIRRRVRHCYWLNPEPRAYWGSGDSIISRYERLCDDVVECRNLRQLEKFIDGLVS